MDKAILANLAFLAMGAFIGWLLAFGLFKTEDSLALRSVITIIGVALGVEPFRFFPEQTYVFFYPIGLLIGLCFMSLPGLIERVEKWLKSGGVRRVETVKFAKTIFYGSVVANTLVAIAAVILAFLVKD